MDEATNVAALRDLGTHIRFELQEPHVRQALVAAGHENLPVGMHSTFVCGKDDKGPSAYLLLFCLQVSAGRGTNLIHQTSRRIVKRHEQPGHVEWDGSAATLFDRDGNADRLLPTWDLTVERLDVWFSSIRPGFVATGVYDRSFSFIQKRWHETEPSE